MRGDGRRGLPTWLVVLSVVAVAATVGYLAAMWLTAWSGVDSDPPVCWNAFGVEVSCSANPAVVLVGTSAVVVVVLLGGLWARRRAHRRS